MRPPVHTGYDAVAAVHRSTGIRDRLVFATLDDQAQLGYKGWWMVCEEGASTADATVYAVSPNDAVHRFDGNRPWVARIRASKLPA